MAKIQIKSEKLTSFGGIFPTKGSQEPVPVTRVKKGAVFVSTPNGRSLRVLTQTASSLQPAGSSRLTICQVHEDSSQRVPHPLSPFLCLWCPASVEAML